MISIKYYKINKNQIQINNIIYTTIVKLINDYDN